MGKGLSPLQRFILKEAHKKKIFSNADVLIKRYGFTQISYGSNKFDRHRINIKRYLSTTAAVARGLMIRNPGWSWWQCFLFLYYITMWYNNTKILGQYWDKNPHRVRTKSRYYTYKSEGIKIMTARKPKSEHKKHGQPSKYKEDFDKMAFIACSEGGFSDKKLGLLFSVCEKTINTWKNRYPNFLQSIRSGKDDYDSMEIEKSLGRLARGFSYKETVQEPVVLKDGNGDGDGDRDAVVDEDGSIQTKMKTTRVTTKYMAPNERAIEFWLRNRNRERWPDNKQINHGITEKLADHSERLAAARNRMAKD